VQAARTALRPGQAVISNRALSSTARLDHGNSEQAGSESRVHGGFAARGLPDGGKRSKGARGEAARGEAAVEAGLQTSIVGQPAAP